MSKEKRTSEIKKVLRSTRIVKTISWRIIAWGLTTLLAWIFIGNISVALSIGAVDVVIKLVGFYLHDLAWENYSQKKIREIKKRYPKE